MATGKAIGEFSMKAITATYSPGPAGGVLSHVNWEGTATGFGTIFGTATYSGGPKGGNHSWCGVAYLDNGDALTALGQGTYETTGKHRWRTEAFMQLSDGRRISSEGEMDLASRTWKGKVFELS
jgi:hypothetical protein